MVHIGIVGARKYRDRQSVIKLIHSLPKDAIIVTSSCRGVCTWAGSARKMGLPGAPSTKSSMPSGWARR